MPEKQLVPEWLEPSSDVWVVMILWENGSKKKWIPTTAMCLSLPEGTVRLRRLEDSAIQTKSGKEYKLQRYILQGE